jgi:ferredoxin
MPTRITIDRERCIGSGNCGWWAPNTFDLDDDGVSFVVDPAGDDDDKITNAAAGCPTGAIALERSEP